MASSNKRVADVIAERLAHECSFAFGVPGGEVLTLIDALRIAGIRFVLSRHETSAGFMAEGTQRVLGGVGVLVATLGPGVANTVNIVSHAQQARRPLIVLTGCASAGDRGSYTHQIFDHRAVLAPITKAQFEVAAESVQDTIERAVVTAISGVPGPVHVEVPVDVADALVAVQKRRRPARSPAGVLPSEVFERAKLALEKAKRPVILAGLELLHGGGAAALRRHAERVRWPVLTTYEAKGIVQEGTPPAVAAIGLSERVDRIALALVAEADLVLLAGYDPIEVRHRWRHPFPENATVVDVTRQPAQHGMHRSDMCLEGEPAAILDALFESVSPTEWTTEPEQALRSVRALFAYSPSDEQAWGPEDVLRTLEEETPANAIVTVDTGAHRILLCEQWRFAEPGHLFQSNGLCTMACAIPLALGAKLAAPTRPVVAVVGDGGLEMALGELGTARDEGLPVVIVVLDDRSLALIEKKQRQRSFENVGVDFGHDDNFAGTDYAAIARAFGGRGERVHTDADLRAALATAFSGEVFTLIHCPVPRRAYG
ncbi:MAG: acetolactate synthase-1/2/3 large subunit [Polyangiales bacterium]